MAPRRLLLAACLLFFSSAYCHGGAQQALPNIEAKLCTSCLLESLIEKADPVGVSCAIGLVRSKTVNVDVDSEGCFVISKPDPSMPKTLQCSIEFSRPIVETPRVSVTRTFTYNSTDGSYSDKYVIEACLLGPALPHFNRFPASRHGFGGFKKPPVIANPGPVIAKAAPKIKHLGGFFGHHKPKLP